MNLSKKTQAALMLTAIFACTFIATLLAISFTQSAYSTPDHYTADVAGMDFNIGPKPNATNVPLDTTITIDALSSAALDDLRLEPEVPIAGVGVEVTGTLSYQRTFYPAQLLKPATSYTVYVTIRDVPVSWSFTTTPEPYQPSISYYLATNALWIALSATTATTALVSLILRYRKKQVNKTPTSHSA
jgi:hypothetical protein